jgi:hypothetical protein
MNRRTILKSLAVVPAAAVALPGQDRVKPPAPSVEESPKLETAVADVGAEPVVRFFSAEQFAALGHLAEVFEPSSGGLPGANEARAAAFLDFLIGKSPAARQTLYRMGLDRLNGDSRRRYSRDFAQLDGGQSETMLAPLRKPWTYEDPADPLEHFLREAKADISQATRNSYEFISVAANRSRSASGVGEFWFPIY